MKRLGVAVLMAVLAVSVARGEEQAPAGKLPAGTLPTRTLPTRTWEELKAETLARAERGAYPVFHLDPNDVHTALDDIHSLSPDEWGAAWMKRGDAHFERAQARAALDPAAAREEYLNAWGFIRSAAGRSRRRRTRPRAAPRRGRLSKPMAGSPIPRSNPSIFPSKARKSSSPCSGRPAAPVRPWGSASPAGRFC